MAKLPVSCSACSSWTVRHQVGPCSFTKRLHKLSAPWTSNPTNRRGVDRVLSYQVAFAHQPYASYIPAIKSTRCESTSDTASVSALATYDVADTSSGNVPLRRSKSRGLSCQSSVCLVSSRSLFHDGRRPLPPRRFDAASSRNNPPTIAKLISCPSPRSPFLAG